MCGGGFPRPSLVLFLLVELGEITAAAVLGFLSRLILGLLHAGCMVGLEPQQQHLLGLALDLGHERVGAHRPGR